MECVSMEDPSRDVSRTFARVSLQEDRRASVLKGDKDGRFTVIVGSIDEDEENLTCRERVVKLLESMPFQIAMASCILLNAAIIGGETDFPELEIWKVVETAFLVVFTLELLLRMFSVGLRKFFEPSEDQLWNLFDFSIVGLGLFDLVFAKLLAKPEEEHHHHTHKSGGGVSTLFRMIRLLRILRIFKIVRFLKQLYMLAFGFVEAIQAICWVSVLMFFVLYICSIIMVRTYGRLGSGNQAESAEVLSEQFKSIMTSMLSLFELMSNPGNLAIYHVVMQDFPMLTIFLISFVIFGSFGMIALLTGVISESMFEKNQTRALEERQEREQKRELLKQKCVDLFATVDRDSNDEACPADLEDLVPYVREMFEKLDIEYMQHDFDNIILICDTDSSGSVSEGEFVSGILSLCDGVRAASIQEVYYLVSQMNAKVDKMEVLQDDVQNLSRKVIPELQEGMRQLMRQMETGAVSNGPSVAVSNGQPRPSPPPSAVPTPPLSAQPSDVPNAPPVSASNTVSNPLDTSLLTQATEAHLCEMKASLASTMDEHTKQLSQKLDDLKANFKELYGSVFTVGELEVSNNKHKADAESSPVLPDMWAGTCENGKGTTGHSLTSGHLQGTTGNSLTSGQHDDTQRISPLPPPPMVGSSRSLPGRVDQRNVPLTPPNSSNTARTRRSQ